MAETFRQQLDKTIPFGEETNWSFEDYLSFFGLSKEEISYATILDIGGGVYRTFAAKSDTVSGLEVMTLEPRVAYEKTPYLAYAPVVAGVWDKLPFKDNSFNYVVSARAIPMWAETKEELKMVFDEISRVLKPNGEGRFYPPHHNIFWDEVKTGTITLPNELDEASGATRGAHATLMGLQNLGVNNLFLIAREPLPNEFIFNPRILVYRSSK